MKFLETRVPPPVQAIFSCGLMWALNRYWPVVNLIPKPWNRCGFFLAGLGLTIGIVAVIQFRWARTTTNPVKPHQAVLIVTNGIFGFCRNPMYLGLLLVLSGCAFYLGGASPWIVLPVFFIYISRFQITPEERILTSKFGAPYQVYMKKVGRWSPFF